MYDDVVFVERFGHQLTMIEVYILIGLSRILGTGIAYEIAILNITTGNWRDAGNDLLCRTLVKR